MSLFRWIDQRKHWWKVFVLITAVSVAVVGYIGYKGSKRYVRCSLTGSGTSVGATLVSVCLLQKSIQGA